jgi:hypothetical protein
MAVAAFLAGCLGGDDETVPAGEAARSIAAVVERLERATAQGDFATVCDQLFTAAARERAGGGDCERLTRSAAEGISRPRIEVRSIDITAGRATVEIVTRAEGQAVVPEVLELRREPDGWRVESLAE